MGDYVAGSWVLRIFGEIPQAIRGRVWFSFGYCGGCVFDLVCWWSLSPARCLKFYIMSVGSRCWDFAVCFAGLRSQLTINVGF